MRPFDLRAALLVAAVLSTPGVADAAGLDQFIGFGDSTMDSGYFRYGPTEARRPVPEAPIARRSAIAATVAAGGSGAFVGPGRGGHQSTGSASSA